MRKLGLAGMSAIFAVAVCATGSLAADENVTAKKMQIKDHASGVAKRQIQVQSADAAVQYADAVSPNTTGTAFHLWSASDEYCLQIAGSESDLWTDTGKAWKYKNAETKNQLSIQDGKLQVKIKSGVGWTLANDFPQGSVSASVQFGATGSKFCMTCAAPTKDEEFKFQAKDCTVGSCAGEPGGCLAVPTTTTSTTTTTTTTTTTSTTTTTLGGTVVGAIRSNGRFNLNMMMGVPAGEAACASSFPGSHLCKYTELVNSQGAPLMGLQDTQGMPATVTSFWAYDPTQIGARQCIDDIDDPDSPRWVYDTGHQGVGGDIVPLNNGAGTLGAIVVGGGANKNCGNLSWIGCCAP